MTDDKKLMEEIKAHAQRAVEAAPNMTDGLALAAALGAKYPHRTVDDIREQITAHWQANGLFLHG